MGSRAKLIVQMAIQSHANRQSQSPAVAEANELTTSFDENFSSGYIELSPCKILASSQEETLPVSPQYNTDQITVSEAQQSYAELNIVQPLIYEENIFSECTELSPANVSLHQNEQTSLVYLQSLENNSTEFQDHDQFSANITTTPNNDENTYKLNSDGDLENYVIRDVREQDKDYHFEDGIEQLESDENNNADELESYSDGGVGDKNYKTESDLDSDDSDLNLLAIKNRKKKKLNVKNDNGNAQQNNSGEQELTRKSRKRQRHEHQWKRNEKKQKRNTGQAYTTILKTKLIPERKLKKPCNDSCRYKCFAAFTHEERETIFKSFWKIGDNTRQRQFISSYIDNVTPKYRYPKENTTRSINQSYFLLKNKEKVRVCKQFFMATLDIGDTMIRTTLKKRDDSGIVEDERRGKHGNQKKLEPSLRDGVRNHIDSIPRVESHYLRNQTKREYFEGDLNISILYRLYKEKCIEVGANYVKKCIYEKIFNSEYNIGFFQPKKDQCSSCETYKNSNEEEKQALEETHKKHIREKEMSRQEKARDIKEATEEENKIVAVYDLQAVLPNPCGDVSSFYYKSKLATYNFTIFDTASKEGCCYVWSENCAKRGANEIGTCVLKFLQDFCDGKSVTFYSDNCAGQNKNKFIAAMYLFAVSSFNIPCITHKFLVSGHSQNEGDSMHSCIEREKKRVLKSGPIYVPSQWIPVIRLAKKNGKPYNVFEMDTFDIFDFKELSSDIGSNYNVNTDNEKVLWGDIKILMFTKNAPYSVFYKNSYDQPNYSEIDVRGRRSTRSNTSYLLKKAYKEAPKISKNKKEGLLFLCKTKAIKAPYHPFYNNLSSEN